MNNIVDIKLPISFSKPYQVIHVGLISPDDSNEVNMYAILISCSCTISNGEVTLQKVKFNVLSPESKPVTFDPNITPAFELSGDATSINREYRITGRVIMGTSGFSEFEYELNSPLKIKENEFISVDLADGGVCCGRICKGIFVS